VLVNRQSLLVIVSCPAILPEQQVDAPNVTERVGFALREFGGAVRFECMTIIVERVPVVPLLLINQAKVV